VLKSAKDSGMLENHHRLELYRIFARLFTYPDHSLLEDLPNEATAVAKLLGSEHLHLAQAPSLHELQTAYTRLFISHLGGVPAPPYGSIYLEDNQQLMGQTSLCALRAYEDEGLSYEQGTEPPDFIATELEFLYYLTREEIAALKRQELELAHSLRQKQGDFCHILLQPWIKIFCRRILEVEDCHPVYRWSANALLDFCGEEETFQGVSAQGD